MTTSSAFDPTRSAEIRALLIDTVDSTTIRRRPAKFALIATLTGVALALAGGTAALALSGVLHFGAPEPAPAPPTPVVTPTPTSTPTSTPTPTTRPVVQSTPIMPHDVSTLPASPSWSLDLAGTNTECTMLTSWDLSDGRALYLSGIRPKEYEGSDCINDTNEDIALTLVDTEHGTKLWTREWAFTPDRLSLQTTLRVLGTSGRAVIAYGNPGYGPHEVLDLATGQTIAPFDPGIANFSPGADMAAIADGSGDLIVADSQRDVDGTEAATSTLRRIDPRDPAHPKWSTTVDGNGVSFSPAVDSATAVPLTLYRPNRYFEALISSADGTVTENPSANWIAWPMSTVYVGYESSPVDEPQSLQGVDASGTVVWTASAPPRTLINPVSTVAAPSAATSSPADAGLFVASGRDGATLYDQATGDVLWTAPAQGCEPDATGSPYNAVLDAARDAIVVTIGDSVCTYDRGTGATLAVAPGSAGLQLIGPANFYSYDVPQATVGTARDATGSVLWTRERRAWESWRFSGGYLVTNDGNHLESIG
jgi:hypothetical protein